MWGFRQKFPNDREECLGTFVEGGGDVVSEPESEQYDENKDYTTAGGKLKLKEYAEQLEAENERKLEQLVRFMTDKEDLPASMSSDEKD